MLGPLLISPEGSRNWLQSLPRISRPISRRGGGQRADGTVVGYRRKEVADARRLLTRVVVIFGVRNKRLLVNTPARRKLRGVLFSGHRVGLEIAQTAVESIRLLTPQVPGF